MLNIHLLLIVVVCVIGCKAQLKCKSCDSLQTKECATEPEKIVGFCNTTEPTHTCYTYLEGEITKRGCVEPKPNCEETLCKSCNNTADCNIDIVPADRKLCFQCRGNDTCSVPGNGLKALPCQYFKAGDECFTYVSNDYNIYRGCVSDNLKECVDNEKYCKKCSDNGCNTDPPSKIVTCLSCSSKNDKTCKRPEKPGEDCKISIAQTCDDNVLLGRDPTCYTQYDGDLVERGCGTENVPTSADVETCSEQNCNNKCALEPACYICDSDKAAGCKTTSLDSFSANCTDYASSCSLCETNDAKRIVRSCGNKAPENFVCKTCRTSNCNKDEKLPKMCYTCDSITNPKCVRNEGIESTFCSSDTKKCFVELDANGTTTRGCKEAEECKSGCETCDGHNCNTKVLVQELISCYVCDDSSECVKNQKERNTTSTECSTPGDQCYMIYKEDKTMKRGCLAGSATPSECKNNDAKCVKCSTLGCNSAAQNGTSGLKCIQCKDKDACPWRHLPMNASDCTNEIPYTKQELCYTLTQPDGLTVRGCLSEQSSCSLENRDCRVCYDDSCNTQATQTFSCIRCRSDVDPACAKTDSSFKSSPCANAPFAATLGCYIKNNGGVIIRGCLADLEDLAYSQCQANNKCDKCSGQGCNTGKAPGNSATLHTSSLFILVSILILFKNFT